MCFKTWNYSPYLGQTHVYSTYVSHGKRLKMNLPTSSGSISGLNCLELQALLLCLLVLAPRYGCFLQSQLRTESGRAVEYRRLASTCSKTERPSKKQHKLSNVNDKNAVKPKISMLLTQESCSWWGLLHHQPQPNDLLLQPARWLAPIHTSIRDSRRSQRTRALSDLPEQNKPIWTEHLHCKVHAVGDDLRHSKQKPSKILLKAVKMRAKWTTHSSCYSCFKQFEMYKGELCTISDIQQYKTHHIYFNKCYNVTFVHFMIWFVFSET